MSETLPRRVDLPSGPYIEQTVEVSVRFQEIDAMRVVWHGWYLGYFEEARVALGRARGISYEHFVEHHLMAPVVDLRCQFHSPATFGDRLLVTARLYPRDIAKLEFGYLIHRCMDNALVATGWSVQVFTDQAGRLVATQPSFYRALREQWQTDLIHDA